MHHAPYTVPPYHNRECTLALFTRAFVQAEEHRYNHRPKMLRTCIYSSRNWTRKNTFFWDLNPQASLKQTNFKCHWRITKKHVILYLRPFTLTDLSIFNLFILKSRPTPFDLRVILLPKRSCSWSPNSDTVSLFTSFTHLAIIRALLF